MRAPTNILRTKLYPPKLSNDHVHRVRLIEKLNNNYQKNALTLVSAPAGYGKSYLVSCWLIESKLPYGWISLSEDDNDIGTFLDYLVGAVEKVFPEKLEKTSDLLQAAELPPVSVILNLLINELDEIEKEFVLVLDDYFLIKEKKIHDLIDGLLQYPPENMILCIITRRDPPLKIGSLRAYNRMNEIRMEDLSFKVQEIPVLYKNMIGLGISEETSERLLKRTEGWVTGLRLTAHSVKTIEQLETILKKMKTDNRFVTDYLVEEVLSWQAEEYQKYLMKTSLLDRFCADVVEVLDITESTEKENKISGEEFIEWLEKTNLFVIPLDDENKWFRYHHEFQRLLQKQLKKKRSPEQIETIHKKASEWFEKNNLIVEAIKHTLAGGNPTGAGQIVERHRWTELDSDNWYVVKQWLSFLPEELKSKMPDLLLSEAWCAYENFQLEKIPVLIEKAQSLLKDNEKDSGLLGECYLMLGLVMHWSGIGKIALDYFEKALRLLPKRHVLAIGMLHLHIALARSVIGEKEASLNDLKIQLSENIQDPIYKSRLMAGLFYINQFAGNLPVARNEAQRIQKLIKKHFMPYTYAMAICMEGTACFAALELEEAQRLFTIAGQQRHNLHKGTALDAIAGKTVACQLLGQSSEADKSLALLENFEKESNITGYLPFTQSCRARLSVLRGNLESALAWESTLNESPTFAGLFVWIEVPIITQARVLISDGSEQNLIKAVGLLDAVRKVSEECHLVNQIIEITVLQSVLLEKQGKHGDALATLAESVKLGEPGNWIRPFVEAGLVMKDLLKKLLNDEKESMYIKEILKHFSSQPQTKPLHIHDKNTGDLLEPLTTREIEILSLLSKGLKNREIGDKIFLAQTTIKKHIYNIYQKLDVHSRIEVVTRAKELNIIS